MVLKIYARHLAAGNSGCKQILITASGHLVLGIQQHFASLTSSSGAGVTPGLLSYHGDATFDEEATVPFQDIPTTEFPLFYTLGKLLRVLDISLPGEKFPGFRFDGTKRSREVDFARFATHYYRHLPLWIQKRFEHGGSTVYSEIMSVIKGSAKSVLMGRPLTRKEYLRIDARDSELSDVDRENVYVAYTAYKERLASLGEWDVCDALLCLHQRLQANPRAVPDFAVESLNVDEVQDSSWDPVWWGHGADHSLRRKLQIFSTSPPCLRTLPSPLPRDRPHPRCEDEGSPWRGRFACSTNSLSHYQLQKLRKDR